MSDLLLHFVCNIRDKLAHVVVAVLTGVLGQSIDQFSCLFNLGKAAPASQAMPAVIAAGSFAFAGNETAQTASPSALNSNMVTSPSMSVISAARILPLS